MPMFTMRLRVTLDGHEPADILTGPGDLVRLERQFGVKAGMMADEANLAFEHFCFLAWSAMRRQRAKETPESFDEFIDHLADLETFQETNEEGGEGNAEAAGAAPVEAA